MKKTFILSLKIGVYSVCFALSLILSFSLKYAFLIPDFAQKQLLCAITWIVPLKLFFLIISGEFKGIFSYFRLPDLFKIVTVFTLFSLGLLLGRFFDVWDGIPSREIILSDLLFSFLFILFFRTSLRIINRSRIEASDARHTASLRIALIGSDDFASQVISELKAKHYYHLRPVAVLDDNPRFFGRNLHGVPVLGVPEMLRDLVEKNSIDGVVFAGALQKKRLTELMNLSKSLKLKPFIIPSMKDFLEGRAYFNRLRPLNVEDFLSRDPITLNLDACQERLQDKIILITGAGGSIGSELTRQIASKNPKQLILIDHSEFNLFKIQQSLLREGYTCEAVLLNITHQDALKACFEKYHPQIVFHAAAYKHVPLLESQPLVALKNNVLGTGFLAHYASLFGVERFVLISTDKAINPVNYMGASKCICEQICAMTQMQAENKTQFMSVRFGNVLGSAGSVLPTWEEQIAQGGPVTVTHPDMTRYFMTIPEAVSLILEAFSFEKVANKTFVLDMGEPVKMLDVAKQMIELNGLRIGSDIQIIFTGIRPGEKIHEDLIFDKEEIVPTAHNLIGEYNSDFSYISNLKPVQTYLSQLKQLKTEEDCLQFIREFIPDFKK